MMWMPCFRELTDTIPVTVMFSGYFVNISQAWQEIESFVDESPPGSEYLFGRIEGKISIYMEEILGV